VSELSAARRTEPHRPIRSQLNASTCPSSRTHVLAARPQRPRRPSTQPSPLSPLAAAATRPATRGSPGIGGLAAGAGIEAATLLRRTAGGDASNATGDTDVISGTEGAGSGDGQPAPGTTITSADGDAAAREQGRVRAGVAIEVCAEPEGEAGGAEMSPSGAAGRRPVVAPSHDTVVYVGPERRGSERVYA